MFTYINHGREEQYKNIGMLIIFFVFLVWLDGSIRDNGWLNAKEG